jgi:Tfp pilus assembly protein PilF
VAKGGSPPRISGGKTGFAHYFNGYQYYQQGDFRSAAREYQKAIQIDPNLLKARVWLAKCYDNLGEKSKAREQCRKIRELAPDSREADDARRILSELR